MALRLALVAAFLSASLCSSALAQPSATPTSVPPGTIRVTLLGTASGPRVHPGRAGIATLDEAGGQRLLFDAGRGVMPRLIQAGLPNNAVTKVFLTHLHSDHVVDLPDLLLMPWAAAPNRREPLQVWGPAGTRDMMSHLEAAFAFDIRMRRDVDESFSPEGITVLASDIGPGKVYERDGVTVTAFPVSHGRVDPAFGYRIDYGGRAVAISGDTAPSDTLIAASKGVDVLIHEAIDLDLLRTLVPDEARRRSIITRHTTPAQAARVFSQVSPKLAVFSHSPGTPAIVEQTRQGYAGRVEMGDDLMVIEIGPEIQVVRATAGLPR